MDFSPPRVRWKPDVETPTLAQELGSVTTWVTLGRLLILSKLRGPLVTK